MKIEVNVQEYFDELVKIQEQYNGEESFTQPLWDYSITANFCH